MKPQRGTIAWSIAKNQEWPHRVMVKVPRPTSPGRQYPAVFKEHLLLWLKSRGFGGNYTGFWVMPNKWASHLVNPHEEFCVRFKDEMEAVRLKLMLVDGAMSWTE